MNQNDFKKNIIKRLILKLIPKDIPKVVIILCGTILTLKDYPNFLYAIIVEL